MFEYIDNEQLRKEVKKMVIDSGMKQKEVDEKMGCKPQQYTNIVGKENFAFRDVKRIANAAGCIRTGYSKNYKAFICVLRQFMLIVTKLYGVHVLMEN